MTASLAKLTVNNAQGNYTPNCLLFGMFELRQSGELHLEAPINAADGQLIAIRITQPGAVNHGITWDASYKDLTGICTGGLGQGNGNIMLFIYDNGEMTDYWSHGYEG